MKTIALNAAIAAVYFLLGALCLQLIVPFSKVGSIWPPAGIALAVTLIYGKRVLPATFIGNTLVNAFTFGFSWQSMPTYATIGLGAMAGTWIGSDLIRRYVGFPNDWLKERDILVSLLCCAPVGCLVSASIGVSTIALQGYVSLDEATINWFCWWVGDLIGIMTFTPMTLALLQKHKPIWHKRRYSLIIPLAITFSFIVLFFYYVLQQEKKMQQQHFASTVTLFARTLEQQIETHLQLAKAIRDIYSYRPQDEELRRYLRNHTSTLTGVKSIEWITQPQTNNLSPEYALWLKKVQNPSQFEHTSDYNIYCYIEQNHIILSAPLFDEKKQFSGIVNYQLSLEELIENIVNQVADTPITLKITSAASNKTLFTNLVNQEYSFAKTIPLFIFPTDGDNWIFHFYQQPSLSNSSVHWAIWWVLTAGFLFTSLLSLGILMMTGRYNRIEAIVKDRTAELSHAKEMAENANHAKDQFLSNVSHELRAPLNGVLGFSELLKIDPLLNEEQRNKLDIINNCGNQLLQLIDDMLDFSRIEAGKIVISPQHFDLKQLLWNIQKLYALRFNQKKLYFRLNIDNLDPPLFGDEKRIRQILINLIDNALKFTDSGGVTVTASYADAILKLSVADTGRGIPADKQRDIFQPFTQINDNEFSHEGIGLGLSITARLVELMKGHIDIHSETNQGTEFIVELPLPRTANEQALLAAKPTATNAPSISILVVEDNDINQLLIMNMLESMNCKVTSALNGEEALLHLRRDHFHLALIDLNMPVMNGFSLIKAIQSDKNIAHLKTVAISAYADKNTIKKAFAAGFDDYLTKPINEQDLRNIIQSIAQSPQPSAEN
ncbi:ATP-binding protein [Methylomarinum vadi]|uniref:ATP-binding protein n=1 Tax=Methylomarinum vadi TaxID=438855 RepID=UPI000689AF53|nr:ATP-binding protein [Methylomarinum vadi]